MENNIENKAKFFGLYFGHTIIHTGIGRAMKHLGKRVILNYENSDKFQSLVFSNQRAVELKPLSSISDEDALYLAKMNPKLDCKGHFEINPYPFSDEDRQKAIRYVKNNMPFAISNDRESADYLRSKGYAIDWINLSVKKQIEYGWVKLKDNA